MEEKKVSVDVDLKTEDIYSYQKAVFYKQLSPTKLIIINVIFLLIAVGSIIVVPPFGSNPVLTIMLISFVLFFLVIVPLLLKRVSKNAFKTYKLLQKTQNYQIGSEGIAVSSESSNGFIKWDEFYEAVETKDSFLFFISKRQAYIVPKRCFNETAGQQLESLRSHMKNAPKPKEDKLFGIFKKTLGFGCLAYFLLFLLILTILTLYSPK